MIFNIAHFCALSNPFPKIFRIFFVPAPGRPRIGKSNAAYRFEENTGLFSDRYHIKYTRFRSLSSRNHEKSRKIHEKDRKTGRRRSHRAIPETAQPSNDGEAAPLKPRSKQTPRPGSGHAGNTSHALLVAHGTRAMKDERERRKTEV